MAQSPAPTFIERLTLRVLHGGGIALLLLFWMQQLALLLGLCLLIAGLSLWSYWLVFLALLCLRGSFFLQALYEEISNTTG